MTANKHTPVDVLACLEHAFISLRIDGRVTESDQIDLARAAVAELIEAAEAYAEAEAALANREIGGINAERIDRLQPRVHAARCDLDAALSRVRGAE